LREWLVDSREELRIQRRLLAAVSEWHTAKQDRSFLASGARLTQFEALTSGDKIALNSNERAYLQASLDERDRLALEEQSRQARELELAQQAVLSAQEAAESAQHAAVSAQKATRSQRTAASRLRYLVGALAVFLLIAAGLSTAAFNSRNDALNQKQIAVDNLTIANNSASYARSIALAAASKNAELSNNPDQAIALAVAANTSIDQPPALA